MPRFLTGLGGILFALATPAELVDRIAATVGGSVITLSEAILQARITAFLNEEPLPLNAEAIHRAIERLVEQRLIRREIEAGNYALADSLTAEALLAQVRQQRFGGQPGAMAAALRAYGLTETELRDQLQWQATVVRFVDQRFRAGALAALEDIQDHYREKFVPAWRARHNTPPPPLEEVESEIEAELIQQQVAILLDRWLNQTRTQTEIRYREDAWKGPLP